MKQQVGVSEATNANKLNDGGKTAHSKFKFKFKSKNIQLIKFNLIKL